MLESEQTTSEVLHLNLFGMFQESDFTENSSKCSVVEEESVAHSSLLLTATSSSSSTCAPNNESSVLNNESSVLNNESSVLNNERSFLINAHTDVQKHTHTFSDTYAQARTHSPMQITTVPSTPSTHHVGTHIHTNTHTDIHTVARTCTDKHHSDIPSVGVQKWNFLLSADNTPFGLKDDDDFNHKLSNLQKLNKKRMEIENLRILSYSRQYNFREE